MRGKTFKAAWTFEVFRKHSVTESSHVKWVVWFFPLNLPKANVIIGVLYCHAAERMLSVLMQIAFVRALFLLFICVSRAVTTFLPIRPNDITEQHYK